MRKELLCIKSGESYYSFVYYNSYDKKRIRLSREYIQQRFGKDIVDPDEADDIIKILEKELKTLSTEKEKRFVMKAEDYELNSLLGLYTELQMKAAPNSYQNNIHYLKYYVLHFFLQVKTCQGLEDWALYYEDFREWLEKSAYLITKPDQLISYSSKNHAIRALNTFMRHMHRKRHLSVYVSCPQFPSYRIRERTLDDVVTEKEMERIYHHLRTMGHHAEAVFFRLLYFSGMRFNESCGVSLGDVFDGRIEDETFKNRLKQHGIRYQGYLVIDSQPAKRWGIRDQDGHLPRKPLKGRKKVDEKSARIIPVIDEQLWKDLVILYNETLLQHKQKLWGEDLKNYLLFPTINSTSSSVLYRAFMKLQLRYRSWHCLRHTRATLLIGQTGDFLLTRMWLGHKKQEILERYIHVYQAIVRNAKKKATKNPRPLKF